MKTTLATTNLSERAWLEGVKTYAAEHSACEAFQAAGTLCTKGIISEELFSKAARLLDPGMTREINALLYGAGKEV